MGWLFFVNMGLFDVRNIKKVLEERDKIGIKFVYLRSEDRNDVAAYRTIMNNNMTQEERWNIRYEEVMAFIESNHKSPSKHRIEEHDMLNWVKANRKALNAGKLKEERVAAFKELLALGEQYKRVNQWE